MHTEMVSDPSPVLQQLHNSVVQRWGWDIVSGALPPGSRIVAEDAALHLGVSRTVVREAVRVLDSMGLLTVRRRVGITVLPPESWNPFDLNIIRWRLAGPDRLRHLQSLSELRSAVEPLAARLAGLADVVVEVLAGRTRHRLMPNVAEPEAIRLHGVVASAVQSRDGAAAEQAMREIVAESAVAVQAMQGDGEPDDAAKDVLPSVLSGRRSVQSPA